MFDFSVFRYTQDEVKTIGDHLLAKTGQRPVIGIVCGSGLGGLVNELQSQEAFKYDEIPGFPVSTGTQVILIITLYFLYIISSL